MLGGETKILLWQEIIASSYFVVLYIFGGIIASNVYLVYYLITVPVIGQTILGLVIFKRKKWMKKIS